MKILFVDTNDETRRSVQEFLEKIGHEFMAATNADLALTVLNENKAIEERFAFVIVHWDLPSGGARRLIQQIRRLFPGQRVWITYTSSKELPKRGSSIANDLITLNVDRDSIFSKDELIQRLTAEISAISPEVRTLQTHS